MKGTKKLFQVLALCLAISLSMGMIVVAAVGSGAASNDTLTKQALEQTYGKYQKIDINSITGEGGNPPEISGAASVGDGEKVWYEYIAYSPQPVSSLRLDDNRRLIFYDPVEYSNAMIMDVTGDETPWSSANSLEITYTTGNTISNGEEKVIESSTSVEVADGRDKNYSRTDNSGYTVTKGWSKTKNKDLYSESMLGCELGNELVGTAKIETTLGQSSSSGRTDSEDKTFDHTNSITDGWTEVAKRITTAMGSSSATNTSWSSEELKTVSQVYNAAYFNEAGSPLQWKIIRYTVYMPMKYELQCKVNGEWVTTDYDYCTLTTMQGTCRAFMKNGNPYYEHWGTGEAVLWNDFWDGFFTEQSLLEAYKNKLYPDN